jgi:hypothetical protein
MFAEVPVQLGNLPIGMYCLFPQGVVSFFKLANFPPFFDIEEEGKVAAEFFPSHFVLHHKGETLEVFFQTTYEYKKMPMLLKWLQQLQLQAPVLQ